MTSCGWQPERQQMDALGNVNPTPTTIHSAAFSLSHSVPPNSQEKFSQSPFPLSGYFAVGRRSRPLLGPPPRPRPRPRSFSQCIPLRALFFLGARPDRTTEVWTKDRIFHSSQKKQSTFIKKENGARGKGGERARPLPLAMLTYSLYPTIRGRVAPPPPPALARSPRGL